MRVFRWLAVGCGAAAVGVAAFTGGVWVMRPKAVTVAPKPVPTPARTVPSNRPTEKPTIQPEWTVAVRPVNHETPPPAAPVSIPEVKPASLPVPAGLGEPSVAMQPVVPLPTLPAPSIPPMPKPAEVPTRFVNKPDLEFDYEVTKQGKSGVKAVTLFAKMLPTPLPPGTPTFSATANIGDAWVEVAKVEVGKPTERPKLAHTLDKEGRYGFRVGVSSGSVTATAPKPTDDPEMAVVFDKTPPVIEAFAAAPHGGHPDIVVFSWKVNEPHPAEKVVLEYAAADGRWQPIAGPSDAAGLGWAIPAEAPATVRVRLTVTDRAGNAAQRVIEAVNLDHTVPQGRLTGVTAVEGKRETLPLPKGDEPEK